MNETSTPTPAGRATAVFEPDPDPALRCSNCGSLITDDDADCPTCASPIDWGASNKALRAWQQSSAGGT
jgi:hypothetical protein